MNFSWLVAAGWGIPVEAAGPVNPPVYEDRGELADAAPAPENPLSPLEDFAPGVAPGTETPLAPEDYAIAPPAQVVEGNGPVIPPPDGMVVTEANPLSAAPGDLAADTATPFPLPVAEFPAGSGAGAESVDVPVPAADRTAPWIAAPGGYSMPSAGGFGNSQPSAPSGFNSAAPGIPMGGGSHATGILDGFNLAAAFSGTYDSNVIQSPGLPLAPIKDDFILSLGGRVDYLSKSSEWTFGGGYRGSYNKYLSNPEFSGYSQGGGVVANYEGGPFSATLNGGISLDQGSNRNYSSAFVTQTSYTAALSARYQLSKKTSLQGNIGETFTTASGGNFEDTESFDMGASALWKYSPLTELGPGLRYTYRSGSSQTGRTSIGPTLTVNYKLSSKVALNSRVGMDFASYQDGGSVDPTMSAAIGLNYQASKLWGMNFSLFRDTQADTSLAGAFTEVTSVRVGYRRKVRRATLNLGVGYDMNRSERPTDGAGGGGADRDFFTLDGSLGMPIFKNTSVGSVYFRYSDQSASATSSWDAFQTGFSISRSF